MRALLILLLLAGCATAEPPCDETRNVMARLEAEFAERPVAVGPTLGGNLVVLYAALDRSTWTMIVAFPGGLSCIIETGRRWQTIIYPEGSL